MLLLEYISPHKQSIVSDAPAGPLEKANLVGITEVMNGLSMHLWSSRETTNAGPGGCFWSDCWQPLFILKSWS